MSVSSMPRHRTVVDVMTAHVHVATPSTPFKVLVRLLQENRISAVPIVDQHGMPVGVVSDSDLLLKERLAELADEDRPRHLWRGRHEHEKARGVIAAELMTSPAITIGLDARLAEAARVMQERNVRRLIVVDGRGRIAGIATRSDLLQIFLRTDADLRNELAGRIIPAVMPGESDSVQVSVESNIVTLTGEVNRRSDVEILGRLARDVDGVVDVVNNLTYRWDDANRSAVVS
jgi:CBS domain-containing protein